MRGEHDFSMVAGDTRRLEMEVVDGDGDPVDISGASIRWGLWGKGTLHVSKSLVAGIVVIDAVNGFFDVTIDTEDTQALAPGYYVHHAEVTNNGEVATTHEGTVRITRDYLPPEDV